MVEVEFYEEIEDSMLAFAVIIARTGGKWVFCKHRELDTYEVPGGRNGCPKCFKDSCLWIKLCKCKQEIIEILVRKC